MNKKSWKYTKRFKGKGEIILYNGTKYCGDFECMQMHDGSITCTFFLKKKFMVYETTQLMKYISHNAHKLCGKTDLGQFIEMTFDFFTSCYSPTKGKYRQIFEFPVNNVYLKLIKSKCKSFQLHFGIVNFEFIGTEITQKSKFEYYRDELKLNVDNREIIFRQLGNYKKIVEYLVSSHGIDVTSEAIVRITKADTLDNVIDLINNMCTLLSYARGTYINWLYYDVYSLRNKQVVRTYCQNSYTRPFNGATPVINKFPPNDTKYFVEKCYKKYKKYKITSGFNLAIEFCVESKALIWLEQKYLAAFLTLEVLNDSNIGRKFIMKMNEFKKLQKSIIQLVNSHPTDNAIKNAMRKKVIEINRYPLKMCLDKLLANLTIDATKFNLKRIIKLRNNIVHQGSFAEANIDHYQDYLKLMNLLDSIILKLMEYNGFYHNCLLNYNRERIS